MNELNQLTNEELLTVKARLVSLLNDLVVDSEDYLEAEEAYLEVYEEQLVREAYEGE